METAFSFMLGIGIAGKVVVMSTFWKRGETDAVLCWAVTFLGLGVTTVVFVLMAFKAAHEKRKVRLEIFKTAGRRTAIWEQSQPEMLLEQ